MDPNLPPGAAAALPPMSPSRLARLVKRRVPPEKRQRTEMSCDYCKAKRCKCSRASNDSCCRACKELGQPCQTTRPRKQRMYTAAAATINGGTSTTTTTTTTTSFLHRSPGLFPLGNEDFELQSYGAVLLRPKATAAEYLFEDPLGLPRYIGPTGSFTMLMRLREIMAVRCTPETARLEYAQTMGQSMQMYSGAATAGGGSEPVDLPLPPRAVADALLEVFFSQVNRDYPIFHRALFQAKYERMWSTTMTTTTSNPDVEYSWLMTLYMVFVLGLTASSPESLLPTVFSPAQKDSLKNQFLSKAKGFLADVLSGSTLGHVQALMLYCLHLHISRERNACWNIAGAAIRIAVAIGLHRNGANPKCTPLERELRKRVWWTLYSFERIECSSLGRPSAIDDTDCNVAVPAEGLLDMGDYIPLGYIDAQSRLLKMLGRICKEQSGLEQLSPKHGELARTMSQLLDSWHDDLLSHLRLEAPCPPTHRRPIVLLHIQYYYTVTILTRPFLISKATSKGDRTPAPPPHTTPSITHYARKCVDSAKASADLLQRLFLSGLFNAKTWWDVFFIESTSMILAMGRVVVEGEDLGTDPGNLLDSLKMCLNILRECGELSPTMQRFAKVTTDFGQALVFAMEASGTSQGASQGTSQQGTTHSENGVITPEEQQQQQSGSGSSGDVSASASAFESGQGVDLTTMMTTEWIQAPGHTENCLFDLLSAQEELDFAMPTSWDDPASWLVPQ